MLEAAVQVIRRHLSDIGLAARVGAEAGSGMEVRLRGERRPALMLGSADPPGLPAPVDEAVLQACCGLMHLHGRRDGGAPLRLGVDYATSVCAVISGLAVLAGMLGRARGQAYPETVAVCPVAAVLLGQGHHLAIADAAPDPEPGYPGPGDPPPFRTRDGRYVEIETFRPDGWGDFWRRLAVDGRDIGRGWRAHCARQWTACCRLPEAMHHAIGRHTLADLAAHGHATHVDVVELAVPRGYPRRPWTLASGPPSVPPAIPARDTAGTGSQLPLSGLTVVESTRWLQGPYAGRVLSLLGARVEWIELPDGDPARGIDPVVDGCSAAFRALHHGKQPHRLDLASHTGRSELGDLIAEADVFLHNWPPGRAERLGLQAPDLWRIHPALIYAHASGGPPGSSPRLPRTASDWSIQAYSGLGHVLRPAGGPPTVSQLTLLDPLGGLLCAEGVLAALLRRQRTGRGSTVDASLLTAAHLLLSLPRPTNGPAFHPIRTADGYLALGDAAAARRILGLPRDADRDALAQVLSRQPAAQWERELTGARATAARTRTPAEIVSSRAFSPLLARDRGLLVRPPWTFA